MSGSAESGSSTRWPGAPVAFVVLLAVCVGCLVYLLLGVGRGGPDGLALATLIVVTSVAGFFTLRLGGWVSFGSMVFGSAALFTLAPGVILGTVFGPDDHVGIGLTIAWIVVWGAMVVTAASLIALLAKGTGALAQLALTRGQALSEEARRRRLTIAEGGACLAYLGLTVLVAVILARL